MPNFQTYSWSIGTTSFRVKEINYRIERQLECLKALWHSYPDQAWEGNQALQKNYYNLLAGQGLLPPTANNKAKDARQKTSSLKDLGLITSGRKITQVGEAILSFLSNKNVQKADNIFAIENDAYIYLKQLLKLKAEAFEVRPFVATLFLLSEVEYLSEDEFAYLAPLCRTSGETRQMTKSIKSVRNGQTSIEAIIIERLKGMKNYQEALGVFLDLGTINENNLTSVTMNRKSPHYDKPYFELYKVLLAASTNNAPGQQYEEIRRALGRISPKPSQKWKQLLLGPSLSKEEQVKYLISYWPSSNLHNNDISKFREAFFWQLQLIKWLVNLEEYADLNRRFFSLADILIMKNQKIELQFFAKHYFKVCVNSLLEEEPLSDNFEEDIKLEQLAPALAIDSNSVFAQIEEQTGKRLSPALAKVYVEDERKELLNKLVENRFSLDRILTLLEKIEVRDDEYVQDYVSDNADVPTIFEYVVGICWYYISDRSFDLINSLKLSLDANMLPKRHAGGGGGDIEVYYEGTDQYSPHWLLLEATLTNSTQQRRAEMEPVTRHLGDLVVRRAPVEAYAIFISNHLDKNVVFDFRSRKHTPHISGDQVVNNLKIMPLNTGMLKYLLKNNVKYPRLYNFLETAYSSETPIAEWFESDIEQRIEELQ